METCIKVIFEKHQERITLLMCGRGTAIKIYNHIPKTQRRAFSLCWAIFIAVVVLQWNQGEGSEKYAGFFVCLSLLLLSLAVILTATPCQILPTVGSKTSVLITNLPSIFLLLLSLSSSS